MSSKQIWKLYQLRTGFFLAHLIENPADESDNGDITIINGWAGKDATGLSSAKDIKFNRRDIAMTLEEPCA